jgi:hypothetical protein
MACKVCGLLASRLNVLDGIKVGVFYMRDAIETAPRNGKVVVLEDDASGTYDIAHWSAEAGEWVGTNGEPSKITPTHWHPMSRDNLLQEDEGSSNRSEVGPSAAASDVTIGAAEAQTAPIEAKRTPRRFAASSITPILIAVALIGLYYIGLYYYETRYAGQPDIVRISTTGRQVVKQETQLPSQDSRKTGLSALEQHAAADQARAQAGGQVERAVEASAPEARQILEKEQRAEVLANELAEARRAIDGLNLKLLAEAAKTAQSLGQERQKTAAVAQEVAAARQKLTASTAQHRQALDEEHARSAALASELAQARREVETQVALLRKAGDEAVDVKQKPAAVEERPGVSLPAWANSDALVKPAQAAREQQNGD